jgi:hypothetical protein
MDIFIISGGAAWHYFQKIESEPVFDISNSVQVRMDDWRLCHPP